ncbi:sodium:solute symporter [Microvirga sp. KLBC 81]|uniref:sodium:solute symporter family protein n=1 Tax=Microvirga sp. KLBC 81 TaxID=1862707 RepID=UPI000D515E5B|nr:sodium:solute symporter family protein [Microvirga sp. KLBC 81]PVE21773.1 sodium:solute symporter [Microvirga sp. KLBC 81]
MESKIAWVFSFMMLYWAYCVFWGIKGALQARTATEYFIAGRSLPAWAFIFAATATSFSGGTFVGHPGLTYTDGLPYAHLSLWAITIPLTGTLFLKRQWMLGKRFGFMTPGEMLAYYFQSDLIRLLVVIVALFFSVPYLGLQLRAIGFMLAVLTDGLLGIEFGMWVLTFVLMSYVATGGLRTVAYVDVVQAPLKMLGIVILGMVALSLIGGWERLVEGIAALAQMDGSRTQAGHSHYLAIPGPIQLVREGTRAQGSAWTGSMILTFLFGTMGIMAAPAFSMWAFASSNSRGFAPQQVWISSFGVGAILILFTVIQGLGGHLLGADQAFLKVHPELVNPMLVERLGGQDLLATPARQESLVPQLMTVMSHRAPWLIGLLAVCALAAVESTASCYMATAGAILTRDVLKRFLMPAADDRTQIFVGRIAVVVVVFLALTIASTATDALVPLGGLAVAYGLQMWPALIAVCYWPFLTRQGVTCGLISGLIAVTLSDGFAATWLGITAWGRWPLTIHSAAWGILCNFAVTIVVSLFTKDDAGRKSEFHAFLRQGASLPSSKKRLVPLAWGMVVVWFVFAAGPGAVVGNWIFGDPDTAASWWFGIPSLWAWQIAAWMLGVGMIWFLAYYMELATPPQQPIATSSVESAPQEERI